MDEEADSEDEVVESKEKDIKKDVSWENYIFDAKLYLHVASNFTSN